MSIGIEQTVRRMNHDNPIYSMYEWLQIVHALMLRSKVPQWQLRCIRAVILADVGGLLSDRHRAAINLYALRLRGRTPTSPQPPGG